MTDEETFEKRHRDLMQKRGRKGGAVIVSLNDLTLICLRSPL